MALYHHWANYPASVRQHSVRRNSRQQSVKDTFDSANTDLIDLYRLDKQGILYICDILRDHDLIRRKTSAGLPTEVQVLVALRYYATGNSVRSLKNTADLNLSHGAVEKCIKQVSLAFASLSKDFITSITYRRDAMSVGAIKSGFGDYGEFPGAWELLTAPKLRSRSHQSMKMPM